MEKYKTKILKVLIMLIIFMTTLVSYQAYAEELQEGYLENTPVTGGRSISYDMLQEEWEQWCTEKGIHVPSEKNKRYATYGSSSIDTATLGENEETYQLLLGKFYQSEEIAYYAEIESIVCTPKSAYILNFMNENTGGYPSKVQRAWWTTSDNIGKKVGSNKLSLTADAYQDFVKKIVAEGVNVKDTTNYETRTHTYKDGKQVSIEFPKTDVKSTFELNASKAEVNYYEEDQKYVIGPLTLKYVDYSYGGVDFGFINDMRIYTDASTEPLSNDRWNFIYTDKHDSAKKFPAGNGKDVFYIEMDYSPNITKIKGIDIDYKYLVAGGKYQKLSGTYDKYKWSCTKTPVESSWNEESESYTQYTYELSAKKQNLALKSQTLGLLNEAARWYEIETVSLHKNQATLQIKKQVLDENGNELTEAQIKEKYGEQLLAFTVKVTHRGETRRITKKVLAGSTATIGTFMWDDDEAAPTYEVEEVKPLNATWEDVSISNNRKGTLQNGQTVVVTATNKLKPKSNKIQISKTISTPAEKEEVFKFNVDVTMPNGTHDISEATIIVPQGKTTGNVWISKEYKWIGAQNPTYKIIENETEDSKKYTPTITPSEGELDGSGVAVEVKAYNGQPMSYLTIKKELMEGQVTQDTFDFKVTVDGVKNTDNGHHEFTILGVKAGEVMGPYGFEWKDPNKAPTYTVEEINIDSEEAKVSTIEETVNGTSRVERNTNKISGTLTKAEVTDGTTGETTTAITEIKFTNNMTEHHGNIKVVKNFISAEKMTDEALKAEIDKLDTKVKFDIKVVLKGTFKYKGTVYENTTKVINETLSKDNNWQFTIDDVYWWGETTPTYTVTELRSQEVDWKCVSQDYSYIENESTDEEGFKLLDNSTVTVTVVNEIPSDTEVDLTFEMAGIVWVDKTLDSKNNNNDGYYSKPNGVYDEGEILKENAEVNVYKVFYDASGKEVKREIALAYKDAQNNELSFPVVTLTDGAWDVPRIQVPGVTDEEKAKYGCETASYDVEFTYDGQTYEPTEFLSYKVSKDGTIEKNQGSNEQKAKEYREASKTVKKKYERDSMAIETSNENPKIAKISGKEEINANGETTGIATLTDGREVEITYSSDDAGTGYPNHSVLNTTDDNGRILDIFRATASTQAGNLTFPFDVNKYDGSSLTSVNKEFSTQGFKTKYKFMAIYNYCLHINLGLKERDEVDIALTKNLDNAKVIVNERMYQYNYSGYYDLTEEKTDSLNKDIYIGNSTERIQYTLGLYRSDYYYRAEMYKNNEDKNDVYGKLSDFYANINGRDKSEALKDTELDIYLTYKIKVQNGSATYKANIHSIDDYYDSNLTLVREDETKYLKTQIVGGTESDVNAKIVVANKSDYSNNWNDVKTGIVGSDTDGNGNRIIYNKMTANDLGIELAPGESQEFYMTFKVNKGQDDEFKIEDSIKLGQRCNVAEIASYSTFDVETGKNTGKIDRDSAPGNVNIPAYNQKAWYEDDTFAAPRIKLNLIAKEQDRTINGIAWEDNSKDKNVDTPDSNYNQRIGNAVKDGNSEEGIEGLTTELVQKVMIDNGNQKNYTEYDYTWPTNASLDCLNGKTMEEVIGLDTTRETEKDGEYKFTNIIAGDYVVRFHYGDTRPYNTTGGDYKIESANYSEAKYYNGQDYKSSKLNAELKFGQANLQADSYLDIDKVNDYDSIRNTAVDSERKRLEVIAKSREIDNRNSTIMFNYDDELFTNYAMFADTPKLDMNIELSNKYYTGSNDKAYKYEVNNINFGLEERPITQLSLDKQIEEIILTTSDGINIMDAKYDIDYIVEDGQIKAIVELNSDSYGIDNLQSLNRDGAINNGYRYISVDSSILEGTTITVKYKFTVLNTGEVDRTGKLADMLYKEDITQFDTTLEKLLTEFSGFTKNSKGTLENPKALGEYVGTIYYYGEDKELFDYGNGNKQDNIVTSRVRQVVDYIDNDVVFSGNLNNTQDMSWSAITVDELRPHIDNSIIDSEGRILDEDGISYTTDNRTNIAVSADEDSTNSTINNAGFIVDLQPENATKTTGANYRASMYLTTTKYVSGDSDDLQIDNIAEIIRYNNKVGRRDELTIAGNQNPVNASEKDVNMMTGTTLSDGMVYERDTSATEVITLSPPFGSGLMIWKLQVIASITGGLAILAGGIVFIKKKVLK